MAKQKQSFLAGFQANFETLQRADSAGHLALVETQDKKTGEKVAAVCAIGFDGKEYTIVPLARMFAGNPYDELRPPNPDGGFHQDGAK